MNNGFFNYPYYYTNGLRDLGNMMYVAPRVSSPLSFLTRGVSPLANIAGATTSRVTFSSILNGASKTLGVINQAIPVVYQIKPIWSNAKTMFRMAKAINTTDTKSATTLSEPLKTEENTSHDTDNNLNSTLTFFN